MEEKLKVLLPKIEERLLQSDIRFFEIGRSEPPPKRLSKYEEQRDFLSIVAKGDAQTIKDAECYMIDWISKCEELNKKYTNKGWRYNPNATELYIIISKIDAEYGDSLIDPQELFSFDTIEL